MSERTSTGGGSRTESGGSRRKGSESGPGLMERVQAKVSSASDEHRANSGTGAGRARGSRRARLRLVRLDPWSVMKTAFLLSVAFGIVTVVAVFMIWSVLGAAGVWESINATVASVVEGDNGSSTFDVTDYVGLSRVLGFTLLVSVIDVVLITAIATLAAFLYNMAAALLGGVEVTLAEGDR